MKNKSVILQFIKERFPVHILTFTTLSTVLASASIATGSFTFWQVAAAFVIVTLFLFHIRAIDERRDFANDMELHPDRPVQQGVVSVKTLLLISITGIILSLGLAFAVSFPTFVIAVCFVLFTTLAAFDFFMPELFKERPVIYHIINSPQMILSQWLIFSVFTQKYAVSVGMILFLLLIYNNIFILEVVRKINAPEQDTSESYTAHLGYKKSIAFLIFLVLTGFALYIFIIRGIDTQQWYNYLYGALLSAGVVSVFCYFYFEPQKYVKKLMKLSSVLFYVFMNLLIFISK
jgi:4-hydroxybenzoate polyprenyltransferase